MFAEVSKETHSLSTYQPSEAVCDLTKDFATGFGKGVQILNKSYEELNNYSPIERENKDQRTINSFVDEDVDDPMEAWKWRGTRSMARDKALDMHAHMTAKIAISNAVAQNEEQEEDRQMSAAMHDVIEWLATNSEYPEKYAGIMLGVLYSPAKWLGAEWVEATTTQKVLNDDGSYTTKDVRDEELSGFRSPIYSVDQVLISNVYEQNVQRQHIIIKREYKPRTEIASIWGDHPNWVYVGDGIKTIYSSEDGLFYDIKDEEHKGLCEIALGWCRKTDTEVTFINGIYMGDDNVDWNAIKHRDNFNLPKVPLVPFGYERVNEHFFYWKSLMNRVGWDNALLDAMYENTMNREMLDLYTPMAMYGVDEASTSVMFPGAVVAFENPEARFEPLIPKNGASGYNAMGKIESSIKDKTLSDTMSGQLPAASQRAFNTSVAEQNARTILKGALRSISWSVMRFSDLMKDIAIQHLTTAQWDEITGGEKYRTLLLKDQLVDGKQVSKQIIFDDALVGTNMTEATKKNAALDLLTKVGWPQNKHHIYRINPHLFSKLRYIMKQQMNDMIEDAPAFAKATAERMYALLRQDPLVKPEALVSEVLNVNFNNHADKFMADQNATPMPLPAAPVLPSTAAPHVSHTRTPLPSG